MKISLVLLLVAYAYSASVPKVKNPCVDSELYYLRYYQPYPYNERKYIECDPWGGMEVRDCYGESKWNSWLSRCSDEVLERTLNLTGTGPVDNELPLEPPYNFTKCLYYGNETCQNGGVCNMYPSGGRCVCKTGYVGDYCEKIDFESKSSGIFGMLINESFSLDVYRETRPLLDEYYVYNGTIDTSMVSENLTRQRIKEYLALYPNGTMRFDLLVNYLIQDYLSILYPWQLFMQEFAYESEQLMGYINAIPGLLMSSKYAYDTYSDLWLVYNDVLRRLVEYLPLYIPDIHREAELFFQIYDGIFREFERNGKLTGLMHKDFVNVTHVTVDMIRDKIERDFNETLGLSYDLFRALSKFDEEIGLRAIEDGTMDSLKPEYVQELVANFSMCKEVVGYISKLGESNAEIWDSLSFYGFWYVISEFVSDELISSKKNSTYFLNGTAIVRLIKPSRPNGVTFSNSFSDMTDGPVFQALVADHTMDFIENATVPLVEKLKVVLNNTMPVKIKEAVNISGPEPIRPQDVVEVIEIAEKLVADATPLMPQKLVADSTPVMPMKLVADTTPVMPMKLVADSTPVVPQKLVADTTPIVKQRLVKDTTPMMP